MPDQLGFSVYLTSFEQQREELEANAGSGAPIFLPSTSARSFLRATAAVRRRPAAGSEGMGIELSQMSL